MNRSLLVCLTLLPCVAWGQTSVSWTIDETLTRSETELFWTSPTAIDVGFDAYDFAYEITRIDATATVFGSPVTIDVAPLIADSVDLFGAGTAPTLPAVLFDEMLADDTSGTSANIFIEVDANGFGQAAFTSIVLGAVDVPVLGVRQIESLRVEGVVTLTGVSGGDPSDFTGDGAVDASDYTLWAEQFGREDGQITADANRDGRVDGADYTVWRDRFESPRDATATPEPSALPAALTALGAVITWSRARRPWRP